MTNKLCDHVVGTIGVKTLRASESKAASEQWVDDVRDYNARTMREQVIPPAPLNFANFCMECGEKIDKDGYESTLQGIINAKGGLR
ncbi:conserved hypothetical protein [Vibrio chagasii]|nr:conserved hypothetical protein [Vibrio chagasii]